MLNKRRRNETLDINNRLTLSLWDVLHTMRAISEGKGSQKRILMMLLETGPVTQKKLTALLGIQPGSASEVIGKLEAAGLNGFITTKFGVGYVIHDVPEGGAS